MGAAITKPQATTASRRRSAGALLLCATRSTPVLHGRHVQAVAGFSWGFNVTQSDINFATPRILGVNDWNGHLSLLRGAYHTWTFAEGLIG